MDQEKIDAFNENQRLAAEKQASEEAQLDAIGASGDKVAETVRIANERNMAHRANTETNVKVTNPDLAKTKDAQDIVDSIDKLNLTTFMTASGGLSGITDNLKQLVQDIASMHDKFRSQGLDSLGQQLAPLVERLESVSTQLKGTKLEVDSTALKSITKASDQLQKTIEGIDWQPQINVNQPDVEVPELDLQPLLKPLSNVEKAIKAIEIPKTVVDMKPVTDGLSKVVSTISNLRFPVPNYVLPFKNSQGAATQLQLDSGGNLPIVNNSTAESTTTGTIVANGGTVVAPVIDGMAGLAMGYYGTYSTGASLTIEASFDGGLTYSSVRMLQGNSGTLGYVITIAAVSNSTAFFVADIPNGATHLQVRCSAWAAPTGAINIVLTQSAQRFATPDGAISITAGVITTLTNITNWGNIVDNAAFTDGTTRLSPNGYIYDEVAGTALTENDAAAARIDEKRAQIHIIEDGTTRGRRATITANGAFLAEGTVASGVADTGNPVKIGGRASTSTSSAVSDGQRVDAEFSKTGKQVVIGALREQITQQITTITSSVAETTIVTADATYLLDIYGLILTNTSATATKVTIKDDTAGTTRMVFMVPAGDTRGFMLPVDSGHKQAVVNKPWTVTCGTSVADLVVTAFVNKRL